MCGWMRARSARFYIMMASRLKVNLGARRMGRALREVTREADGPTHLHEIWGKTKALYKLALP